MSRKIYLHFINNEFNNSNEIKEVQFFPFKFQRGNIEKISFNQYEEMNSKEKGSFRYYARKQNIEINFLTCQ